MHLYYSGVTYGNVVACLYARGDACNLQLHWLDSFVQDAGSSDGTISYVSTTDPIAKIMEPRDVGQRRTAPLYHSRARTIHWRLRQRLAAKRDLSARSGSGSLWMIRATCSVGQGYGTTPSTLAQVGTRIAVVPLQTPRRFCRRRTQEEAGKNAGETHG